MTNKSILAIEPSIDYRHYLTSLSDSRGIALHIVPSFSAARSEVAQYWFDLVIAETGKPYPRPPLDEIHSFTNDMREAHGYYVPIIAWTNNVRDKTQAYTLKVDALIKKGSTQFSPNIYGLDNTVDALLKNPTLHSQIPLFFPGHDKRRRFSRRS
jgi:DNA-binding response OmpR family regulator